MLILFIMFTTFENGNIIDIIYAQRSRIVVIIKVSSELGKV